MFNLVKHFLLCWYSIMLDAFATSKLCWHKSMVTNCMQYSSMLYTCPSFQAALEILENNTIINITTNAVLLQSIVHLNQLNNIAIVGDYSGVQ